MLFKDSSLALLSLRCELHCKLSIHDNNYMDVQVAETAFALVALSFAGHNLSEVFKT